MIDGYLQELRAELHARGVSGSESRRILAEVSDHLQCDETAVERLGAPGDIAAGVAEELRRRLTTVATRSLLAALLVAIAGYALAFTAFVLSRVAYRWRCKSGAA